MASKNYLLAKDKDQEVYLEENNNVKRAASSVVLEVVEKMVKDKTPMYKTGVLRRSVVVVLTMDDDNKPTLYIAWTAHYAHQVNQGIPGGYATSIKPWNIGFMEKCKSLVINMFPNINVVIGASGKKDETSPNQAFETDVAMLTTIYSKKVEIEQIKGVSRTIVSSLDKINKNLNKFILENNQTNEDGEFDFDLYTKVEEILAKPQQELFQNAVNFKEANGENIFALFPSLGATKESWGDQISLYAWPEHYLEGLGINDERLESFRGTIMEFLHNDIAGNPELLNKYNEVMNDLEKQEGFEDFLKLRFEADPAQMVSVNSNVMGDLLKSKQSPWLVDMAKKNMKYFEYQMKLKGIKHTKEMNKILKKYDRR